MKVTKVSPIVLTQDGNLIAYPASHGHGWVMEDHVHNAMHFVYQPFHAGSLASGIRQSAGRPEVCAFPDPARWHAATSRPLTARGLMILLALEAQHRDRTTRPLDVLFLDGEAELELPEHPQDCLYCGAGEPSVHNYEPPQDVPATLGCITCGDDVFVTEEGTAHHWLGEGVDYIDHDKDADHVAIPDA